MWRHLVALARPHQWGKGAFVVVGPIYAAGVHEPVNWAGVAGAVLAFGFASSSCYVVNDLRDREADRLHPRKRRRPIASGAVPTRLAAGWALALLVFALASAWIGLADGGTAAERIRETGWLLAAVGVYVLNTSAYSLGVKHVAVLDVLSLASGFVLRVLGGCAAAGVAPSSWLLNCTLFVAMFLAFGKRLGERRTMGEDAAAARAVQGAYTDEFLRMAVVVTGVACLVTYAGYVQAQEGKYTWGFNLLWVTMLPATYGLLRCIVLLERGEYDDPTELAVRDRPFQAAMAVFGLVTLGLILWRSGWMSGA